jgi:predicted aconitase with swiveling domain
MTEIRVLVAGAAEGEALVLDEPLSFWGGVDPATGSLIDARHPQRGERVTGRVLVMPSGRGSSSSSSVLAEAVRAGTAPAAIVLREADAILALGAIVARELYGAAIPVVVAEGPVPASPRLRVEASAERGRIEPA